MDSKNQETMTDPNMNEYFRNKNIRRHLIKAGLINSRGDILPPPSYEVVLAKRTRSRKTNEKSSNINVNYRMEQELQRQMFLRNQFDYAAKRYRIQKMREMRLKPERPVFHSTILVEKPSKRRKARTPSPKRNASPSTRAKSARTRSMNVTNLAVFHPPSKAPVIKSDYCEVTMIYYGQHQTLDKKYNWSQPNGDELIVMQQHCGGENLMVFKGFVKPNYIFKFKSHRHPDYPFAISIYINGLIDSRVSVCCEYRHKCNVRLGSKHGTFGIHEVQNAKPCRTCRLEKRMKEIFSHSSDIVEPLPNRYSSVPTFITTDVADATEEQRPRTAVSHKKKKPANKQTDNMSSPNKSIARSTSPPKKQRERELSAPVTTDQSISPEKLLRNIALVESEELLTDSKHSSKATAPESSSASSKEKRADRPHKPPLLQMGSDENSSDLSRKSSLSSKASSVRSKSRSSFESQQAGGDKDNEQASTLSTTPKKTSTTSDSFFETSEQDEKKKNIVPRLSTSSSSSANETPDETTVFQIPVNDDHHSSKSSTSTNTVKSKKSINEGDDGKFINSKLLLKDRSGSTSSSEINYPFHSDDEQEPSPSTNVPSNIQQEIQDDYETNKIPNESLPPPSQGSTDLLSKKQIGKQDNETKEIPLVSNVFDSSDKQAVDETDDTVRRLSTTSKSSSDTIKPEESLVENQFKKESVIDQPMSPVSKGRSDSTASSDVPYPFHSDDEQEPLPSTTVASHMQQEIQDDYETNKIPNASLPPPSQGSTDLLSRKQIEKQDNETEEIPRVSNIFDFSDKQTVDETDDTGRRLSTTSKSSSDTIKPEESLVENQFKKESVIDQPMSPVSKGRSDSTASSNIQYPFHSDDEEEAPTSPTTASPSKLPNTRKSDSPQAQGEYATEYNERNEIPVLSKSKSNSSISASTKQSLNADYQLPEAHRLSTSSNTTNSDDLFMKKQDTGELNYTNARKPLLANSSVTDDTRIHSAGSKDKNEQPRRFLRPPSSSAFSSSDESESHERNGTKQYSKESFKLNKHHRLSSSNSSEGKPDDLSLNSGQQKEKERHSSSSYAGSIQNELPVPQNHHKSPAATISDANV